jgi:hydroxypyruvate isomerase
MMFTEYQFMDRFAACRDAGFDLVEYPFPYQYPADLLKRKLAENDLRQVLFDLPVQDWAGGDTGYAVVPGQEGEFADSLYQAMTYAKKLEVDRLTCLVGNRDERVPWERQWQVLVNNLRYACDRLAQMNITLLVEMFNHQDVPGFFLCKTEQAMNLVREVGRVNLRIQYDAYHMQKMEGNLTQTVRELLPWIGHIQIADVPDRHEPGTGEVNYRFFLRELDNMGYEGVVGLEYRPQADTISSLGWLQEFQSR